MRKKWISLVALLVIPGLLCITSCTKKFVISEPEHALTEVVDVEVMKKQDGKLVK